MINVTFRRGEQWGDSQGFQDPRRMQYLDTFHHNGITYELVYYGRDHSINIDHDGKTDPAIRLQDTSGWRDLHFDHSINHVATVSGVSVHFCKQCCEFGIDACV